MFHFPETESLSRMFSFVSKLTERTFAFKMLKRVEKVLIWSLVNRNFILLNQARLEGYVKERFLKGELVD